MTALNETGAAFLHDFFPTLPSRFNKQSHMESYVFPEWLRLLLVAAMLYFMRRISSTIMEYIDQTYWVTVSFDDEDACYSEFHSYLSRFKSTV